MAAPAIQLDHVTFQYDSQAEPTLHDINLTIQPGEKVLIVGPSGSGKSTLGNLINRVNSARFSGQIERHRDRQRDGGSRMPAWRHFHCKSERFCRIRMLSFVALTAGEDIAFALEQQRCRT